MIVVYRIQSQITKMFYIGCTGDLEKRIGQHFSLLSNNNHYADFMNNDCINYGLHSFLYGVVATGNKADMFKLEKDIIMKLNPLYNTIYRTDINTIKLDNDTHSLSIRTVNIRKNLPKKYLREFLSYYPAYNKKVALIHNVVSGYSTNIEAIQTLELFILYKSIINKLNK